MASALIVVTALGDQPWSTAGPVVVGPLFGPWPDFPLLQVQPILASNYTDEVLNATELVPAMDGMADADWLGYHRTIVIPNEDPDRPFGAYATRARRRRKSDAAEQCPMRVRASEPA